MIGVMIFFRLSMLKGTEYLHVGLPSFRANEKLHILLDCAQCIYRVSDFLPFFLPPENQQMFWLAGSVL